MIVLKISNASEVVASKVGRFLERLTPDSIDQNAVEDQVIKKLVENLAAEGISTIIWATGYAQDFGWLKLDAFHPDGRPRHHEGIADLPGLYFLGLPWLSMRGSSFIWGVWEDAARLAADIANRQGVAA